MKKSIYQRFLDFKKRHELSNDKITQIATEYANSDLECARSYFSDKYKISEHTFYKARDYAIIFCLVDYQTYKRIQVKSSTNYSNNNEKNTAASSIAYFDKLLAQQQEFLDGFSTDELLDIANKYVEGISTKNIAVAYDTGEYAIKKLLSKGIVELTFDLSLVNKIKFIVGGHGLDNILQKRNANKRALLDCLHKQITFLKLQIKCYDLYFRNSKTKPSLKSLNEQLENAIKMYNETLLL